MLLPGKKEFKPYLDEISLCACYVCDEKGLAYSKFAEYKRHNPPSEYLERHHKAMVELYTQLTDGRHKRIEHKERNAINRMIDTAVAEHNRIEIATYPFVKPIGPHEAQWHKRNGRDPHTGTNHHLRDR